MMPALSLAALLVVASCGPISSPDDGGIVEACQPPCGLGYTCIVDACEPTGWPVHERRDVDAGAGR